METFFLAALGGAIFGLFCWSKTSRANSKHNFLLRLALGLLILVMIFTLLLKGFGYYFVSKNIEKITLGGIFGGFVVYYIWQSIASDIDESKHKWWLMGLAAILVAGVTSEIIVRKLSDASIIQSSVLSLTVNDPGSALRKIDIRSRRDAVNQLDYYLSIVGEASSMDWLYNKNRDYYDIRNEMSGRSPATVASRQTLLTAITPYVACLRELADPLSSDDLRIESRSAISSLRMFFITSIGESSEEFVESSMEAGSLLPIMRLKESEVEDASIYWARYLEFARKQMGRRNGALVYYRNSGRPGNGGACGAEKMVHDGVPESAIVGSPEFAFGILTLINFSFGGAETIEAGEYWIRNFPGVADINLYYYLSLVSYYDSEALYSDSERQRSTLLYIERAAQEAGDASKLFQSRFCLMWQFKKRCDDLGPKFEETSWLVRSMRGYFNAEFGGAVNESLVDTGGAYGFNPRDDLFMENHAFVLLAHAAEMQDRGADFFAVQDKVVESRRLYERAKKALYNKIYEARQGLSLHTRDARFQLQILISRINSIEERLELIDEFLDQ